MGSRDPRQTVLPVEPLPPSVSQSPSTCAPPPGMTTGQEPSKPCPRDQLARVPFHGGSSSGVGLPSPQLTQGQWPGRCFKFITMTSAAGLIIAASGAARCPPALPQGPRSCPA